MLFEQFTSEGLSHFSYAIGCPQSGDLAVIDPRRDVDVYETFAVENNLDISYILETHIHADYASGARELASRTDATLLESGYDEKEKYEISFPHEDLYQGDTLEFGSVRMRTVHTPGHTPEHISFLVYDETRSEDTPMLMLTGDFLFVGSLGRPDLLGEDAKLELAEKLYESTRRLKDLPDSLEIYPAHGAGSMCGAGMSGRPHSTLGFERVANPYLDESLSREAFVDRILSNVPPFPDYYLRMKELNSRGPEILGELSGIPPLKPAEVRDRQENVGAVIIDIRNREQYAEGHIPNSFGIGLGGGLSTWSSWVVPYEQPIILVCSEESDVQDAARYLVRVGLDEITGFLEGGMDAWKEAGFEIREFTQISPEELNLRLQEEESLRLLDVRSAEEYSEAHLKNAVCVETGQLKEKIDEVPRDGEGPLVVYCSSGFRSTVAAGILEQNNFNNLAHLDGGMNAWNEQNLPTESS